MYENTNLHERESGNSMMAFGLGMIAGAVTALLLAPGTGTETRHKLGQVARKVGDRAKEGVEKGRHFVDHQRERFSGAVDEGREAYSREATTSGTTPTSTTM